MYWWAIETRLTETTQLNRVVLRNYVTKHVTRYGPTSNCSFYVCAFVEGFGYLSLNRHHSLLTRNPDSFVFDKLICQIQSQAVLLFNLSSCPYAKFKNPLKFFDSIKPPIIIAECMCGKIIVRRVLTSMGMSKHMISLPFFTPFDFPTADMAPVSCFAQNVFSLAWGKRLTFRCTQAFYFAPQFPELLKPSSQPRSCSPHFLRTHSQILNGSSSQNGTASGHSVTQTKMITYLTQVQFRVQWPARLRLFLRDQGS